MLHSQLISDKYQQSSTLENNWSLGRSSKMNEGRHQSPFALTSRSSSFESVEENIDALEIVTPRTYSHSPSPIPQGPSDAELHPWLYQLFPESYADGSNYSSSHPGEAHYLQGDGTSIYPGSTARPIIGQQVLSTMASDENIFSSAAGM